MGGCGKLHGVSFVLHGKMAVSMAFIFCLSVICIIKVSVSDFIVDILCRMEANGD